MLLLLTHRLHCCMEYIGSSTISIIDRMVLYISNHVTALWNLMGFSTRQAADQPSNYMSVPTQNTQASMQERSITSIRTSVSREHAACDLGGGDGLTTISLKHQESQRQQQHSLLLLILYNLLLLRLDRTFGSSYMRLLPVIKEVSLLRKPC